MRIRVGLGVVGLVALSAWGVEAASLGIEFGYVFGDAGNLCRGHGDDRWVGGADRLHWVADGQPLFSHPGRLHLLFHEGRAARGRHSDYGPLGPREWSNTAPVGGGTAAA